jgi:hypothetical protein
MARNACADREEFFGFDHGLGQGLAGALMEAAQWLQSDHPNVPRIDLQAARIEYRHGDTFFIVLPHKKEGA